MAGEQVSEAVLRELYQGDPAEFVDSRDRRVRQAREAGDERLAAELKALRKPKTAAWAVNRVSAERPDRVAELIEVGDELRAAQRDLRGDEIRRLDRRRTELVRELAEQAAAAAFRAGKSLGEQARRQVESTFAAAVAEPESGRRVQVGALSGALSYSGFGLDELSAAAMRGAASSRREHESGARRGGRRRAHTRAGRGETSPAGTSRPDADEGRRSDLVRAPDGERADHGTSGARRKPRGRRRAVEAREGGATADPTPPSAPAARAAERPEARAVRGDRKARPNDGAERAPEREEPPPPAGRKKQAPRPDTGGARRRPASDSGTDEVSEELRKAEDALRAAERERDDQERDRDELRARLDDLSARLRDTTRKVTRARRHRDTARRRYERRS